MRNCFSGCSDSACSVSCMPGLSRKSIGAEEEEAPVASAGVAGAATTAVGGGGFIRSPAFAGISTLGTSAKVPSGCWGTSALGSFISAIASTSFGEGGSDAASSERLGHPSN